MYVLSVQITPVISFKLLSLVKTRHIKLQKTTIIAVDTNFLLQNLFKGILIWQKVIKADTTLGVHKALSAAGSKCCRKWHFHRLQELCFVISYTILLELSYLKQRITFVCSTQTPTL